MDFAFPFEIWKSLCIRDIALHTVMQDLQLRLDYVTIYASEHIICNSFQNCPEYPAIHVHKGCSCHVTLSILIFTFYIGERLLGLGIV